MGIADHDGSEGTVGGGVGMVGPLMNKGGKNARRHGESNQPSTLSTAVAEVNLWPRQ